MRNDIPVKRHALYPQNPQIEPYTLLILFISSVSSQHVRAYLLRRTILRILMLSNICWEEYCHLRLLRNICLPVFASGVRRVLMDPDQYKPSLGEDEGDVVW